MRVFIILMIISTAFGDDNRKRGVATKEEWAEEIKSQYNLFAKAFKDAEFDVLADMFTEPCYVYPPNSAILTSRDELLVKFWQMRNLMANSLEFTTKEIVLKNNKSVAERGELVIKKADGTNFGAYNYMTIWKLIDQEPKINIFGWNETSP